MWPGRIIAGLRRHWRVQRKTWGAEVGAEGWAPILDQVVGSGNQESAGTGEQSCSERKGRGVSKPLREPEGSPCAWGWGGGSWLGP